MDGLVNDIFTLPLVLPPTNLSHSVSLINCSGWQFELDKNQPMPFVIVENSDISIRDGSVRPDSISDEDIVMPTIMNNRPPNGPVHIETGVKAKSDYGNEITREAEIGKAVNENCLMEDLVETLIMYKCKLCSFKSADKSLLASHIKEIHLKVGVKEDTLTDIKDENDAEDDNGSDSFERMVYMCGSCTEAFGSFAECRIHMAQHHKVKMESKPVLTTEREVYEKQRELLVKVNVACGEEEETDDKSKTKDTLHSDVNKERNIKCPVIGCPIRFSSQLGLTRHKLCHYSDSSKGYFCSYCNTPFNKWSMCANHLWRIHSVDAELYSCNFCKYKTAVRVKMKAHEKIHEGREFMCVECGKMFSQKVQLRNHEVIHMKSKPEQQPRWYTKKECDQCQKTFANSKTLKKHIQAVHSKLKPYVCQVCGHGSATKSMLQVHLRQHTGEKPFSCPTCPFTTGDHNTLRRHRMRHSGERPYQCNYCPYSSIQSTSLRHHLATWHQNHSNGEVDTDRGKVEGKKQKSYKCKQCFYSTDDQDSLLQHLTLDHPSPDSRDSNCLLYGDISTSPLIYQCLKGYKGSKSGQSQCDTTLPDCCLPVIANFPSSSHLGVVQENRTKVQDHDQNPSGVDANNHRDATTPAHQSTRLKDMSIEIAICEEDINYLPGHSLEADSTSLPAEDIDEYQPEVPSSGL